MLQPFQANDVSDILADVRSTFFISVKRIFSDGLGSLLGNPPG